MYFLDFLNCIYLFGFSLTLSYNLTLTLVNFKRACRHLYLFWNKPVIRVYVVSNFHSGWEKKSIIWKIWNFHHGLKFHLGLAIPSWNFSSVYWVEIFACNYKVILKRSLLFSRDEILTRCTELKFQPGLKISI